ncbi:MAG TPA: hypothetical protein VFK09_11500 [Gemmatimonadales bacterium]|nr:hypothetical protein [Gemmatimonadales bacterium]
MLARPLLLLATAPGLAPGVAAQTGVGSPPQTVSIVATKVASVSVALPAGGKATLPGSLSSGVNDFTPVPLVTSWDVDPARTATVSLVAYFGSAPAALAGPEAAIQTSRVLARVPTGGPKSFTPFTGAGLAGAGAAAGMPGASLVLFTQAIGPDNARGGRTDDLQLRIDLTPPPELPPGSYSGVLNLVAITQ